MRPPVLKSPPSLDQSILVQQHHQPPTTFFLSRDPDSDSDDDVSPDSSDASCRDSVNMYGVQSLDDTLQQSIPQSNSPRLFSQEGPDGDDDDGFITSDSLFHHLHDDHHASRRFPTRRLPTRKLYDLLDSKRDASASSSLSSTSLRPSASIAASSRPLTPLNFSNPDEPTSLPSSPKSLSNLSLKPLDDRSFTDEMNDSASQAVTSGDEDNMPHRDFCSPGPDSNSQLIMPSIQMPSRRPFTDQGLNMGRFKVLLAGASGSGKTSLVNSIVQTCDHIVHVDPFPSAAASRPPRREYPPSQLFSNPNAAVREIYASTKPYPSWWSDLEESRLLRRRKSSVLERNICFVDTPPSNTSPIDQTVAIIQYMHQQLIRSTTALNTPNVDLQNMLAGNGGSQVDAVLYLISEDTLATDIQCIQKLCDWTNVIPVISKSDLLSPSRVNSLKHSFRKLAHDGAVKPFFFRDCLGDRVDDSDIQPPFTVSSVKSNDDDNMDASLLMSPDYVQPLVSSELDLLVRRIFDRDTLLWMRHSAAKKLSSQGRYSSPGPRQSITQGSYQLAQDSITQLTSFSSPLSFTDVQTPQHLSGGYPGYTLACVTDHTRHEEKVAQVHLAKWASDLQRSLQNEREKYAALARGERAIWLTERLSECVVDGSLVPISQTPGFSGLDPPPEKPTGGLMLRTPSGHQVEYRVSHLSPHDPLGVVQWADELNRRGWAFVQIVSGFGVVGGLALLLAKTWNLSSRSLSDWPVNYCGMSG